MGSRTTQKQCETCPNIITGRKHKRVCDDCLKERNRVYQRNHYHDAEYRIQHREKAKIYQRAYRKLNGRAIAARRKSRQIFANTPKVVITGSEFMHIPAGKTEKLLEAILRRQIGITL